MLTAERLESSRTQDNEVSSAKRLGLYVKFLDRSLM